MANKWVYTFKEGNMTMRNLLGGKGANLAEMTEIGLPVPHSYRLYLRGTGSRKSHICHMAIV